MSSLYLIFFFSTFRCYIVISEILPRIQNRFSGGQKLSNENLIKIQHITDATNKYMCDIAKWDEKLQFLTYPNFVCGGVINEELLSRDGLHLSYEGTQYVVDQIKETISELKINSTIIQDNKISVDTTVLSDGDCTYMESLTPFRPDRYSDTVKLCPKVQQPDSGQKREKNLLPLKSVHKKISKEKC